MHTRHAEVECLVRAVCRVGPKPIAYLSCLSRFSNLPGGCNTNCNHRGYCDLSSSPPSCLCFPGFGGLECELLASTPEQEAAAALAASKGNGMATKGHGRKNGAGAYNGSAGSNTTDSLPKVRPVDRTICNPACNPDTGVCWQGRCACKDGFTGPTCSDRLCPDDCSYHGRCDKMSGECECYKPYTGATCAGASEPIVPRAVDTLDDVAGPEVVPTDQKINRLFKDKKGLSDNFHLLESASRIRQAKAKAAAAAAGDE